MNHTIELAKTMHCLQSSRSSFDSTSKISKGSNHLFDRAPVCPMRVKSNNVWKDNDNIIELTPAVMTVVSAHPTDRVQRVIPFTRSSSRSSILVDPVCSHRSFSNGHWTDMRKCNRSCRSISTISTRSLSLSFSDDILFEDFVDELEFNRNSNKYADEDDDVKTFADDSEDDDDTSSYDDEDIDFNHSFHIDTSSNVFKRIKGRKLNKEPILM